MTGSTADRSERSAGDATAGSTDERPRVFVSRLIPDAGLEIVRDAAVADIWADELPPPREVVAVLLLLLLRLLLRLLFSLSWRSVPGCLQQFRHQVVLNQSLGGCE